MNVVRENREGQTALLKVTIAEQDYKEAVDKKLREYRRKANVPGFRPGMVPAGMIRKMYGKQTLAETTYQMATDACFDYIKQENIDYVGDVLPSDEQGEFDFDNNTEHEFWFEIGLAPEVNLELSPETDKITHYKIKITDEMCEGYRSNILNRYGELVDIEEVVNDEALTGVLDNGEMTIEDAYVGLIGMTEEERKPFIGKKAGDKIEVNVNELYKSESQRSSILGLKGEDLENVKPEFTFTIEKIRKFAQPELNDEFFVKAFPDGSIKDEKDLDKYIDKQISADLERETEFVFTYEVRNYLLEKANLTMPEAFLKRWLYVINEGKFSMEDIDKDFDSFLTMMKWNVVQKYFMNKLNIKLEQEDLMEEAKQVIANQFAQYGMANVGDEVLTNYANNMLQNKEEANKIVDKVIERKVVKGVTPLLKVGNKSVTGEELGKIFEKMNN